MGDRSCDRKSLQHLICTLLPRIELKPSYHFRLVRRVGSQCALAVECSDPVLGDATSQIAVKHDAGAAKRRRGRVQKGGQRAFYSIDIGDAGQFFRGERLFELAKGHLECGMVVDVDEKVAQQGAVGVSKVGEKREFVVLAQAGLKTEPATPKRKRIRRMAVAVVGAEIRLHISVRLYHKIAV